jgi:DNA invertase Pin-like site-specific DNA recombinase
LQNVLYFAEVIATEMLMLIAYARVSTDQQETELQLEALKAAGAEKFFEERASGGRWDRTELHRMLDQLRPGDVVAVYKLDRLSRSLKDLLLILERLEKAGAGFRSLTEAIDTTTPAGRMMTQIVGSFAEFERAMIRERTRAGLAVARQHGRIGGRRSKLNTDQKRTAIELVSSGQKSAADVARIFSVHPATIGRLISRS